MRVLITANQVDDLIDNGVNPVDVYFKIFHPKIRKRKHQTQMRGYGWTYYDADTKDVLFKYSTGGPMVYRAEDGTFKPYYPEDRIEMSYWLFKKMDSSISNLPEYFKKWFNTKYGIETNDFSSFIRM